MTPPARIGWLLVTAWALFLAVQWGDPFDETEHAHVAWKAAVEGQRPVADFFQHHQPLLWDVQELFYLCGGRGPEVLYFGRALAVACAVAFALMLMRVTRATAAKPGDGFGALGLLPVVVVSLVFPSFWVARPEPLGMALFAAAAWVWERPRPLRLSWDAAAGILFAAALFSSPRFLLLAGAFLLFGEHHGRLALRLLCVALGMVGFIGGYLLLRPYSTLDVWFNIDASRAIAGVGEGYFKEVPQLIGAGLGCVAQAVAVGWHLEGVERRRFLVRMGYGALVLAASLVSTGPYLYAQNLFAPLAWFAVTLAAAEGHMREPRWGTVRSWLSAAALVTVGLTLILLLKDVVQGRTIFRHVGTKLALLHRLQTGDKVLLSSATHPIGAADLSFYVHPLVDAEDRLPRAVEMLRTRWPLPPCDFLADVQRERPVVVDGFVLASLPPEQRRELEGILEREYEPLTPPIVGGQFLLETLFLRRREAGDHHGSR